jgi:hypothetical protein
MTKEMRADLIRRLREYPTFFLNGSSWMMGTNKCKITNDAADEIERLREALREIQTRLEVKNHHGSPNILNNDEQCIVGACRALDL